jgi:hypothetical protein
MDFTHIECLDTWGRITTPLLNLIMIHDSNYLGDEFISFSQLHKSISFLFTLITILIIGNFNNGVVSFCNSYLLETYKNGIFLKDLFILLFSIAYFIIFCKVLAAVLKHLYILFLYFTFLFQKSFLILNLM